MFVLWVCVGQQPSNAKVQKLKNEATDEMFDVSGGKVDHMRAQAENNRSYPMKCLSLR